MAFQLSPGVLVTEQDLTNIVPAVSTSAGAYAGTFMWGPVEEPVTVTSENVLVERFGKPVTGNSQSFFTAANFLAYTNNLLVSRVDSTAVNAVAEQSGKVASITITNAGDSYTTAPTVTISAPDISGGTQATATATIDEVTGEVTAITIVNPGYGYLLDDQGVPDNALITIEASSGTTATATMTLEDVGFKIKNFDDYNNYYVNGGGIVGPWAAKYPGALGNSLKVSMADYTTWSAWAYKDEFDSQPNTSEYAAGKGAQGDEMHIVVVDEDGLLTGTPGVILEKFEFVSKASDAKKADGSNNYYKNVVNANSRYVWWMDHTTQVAATSTTNAQTISDASLLLNIGDAVEANKGYKDLSLAQTISLSGGTDDVVPTEGNIQTAYAEFANTDLYDISLVLGGRAPEETADYLISNIAEVRKDCVVFLSPLEVSTGNIITGNGSDAINKVIAFRDELPSSSYAVMDTGYKYQYDRYNDQYRWVPLNGDIAGLAARTDYTNDAWWSPGGLNRGQIKNVVKLAINPGQTERDNLYKSGVNPVVTFPGEGTVLFGDKTLLAKPSAFDRINVRRLFIVLEKAIAIAARYQLFEFNDSFTRAQFKNLVEPFLRDVQGRRGITDYRVKCDDTNNTGEVIDRNEFVADIFIKPNRSINFIKLNFIAARSAVSFEEIGA
jgi:hypothetical protein